MNVHQLAEEFWHQGFLVLDDFFPSGLMSRYDEMIVDHFGLEPDYLHNEEFVSVSATEVIPWFPQREGVDAFDAVEQDAELQALTTAILGNGWSAQYCMVMFSRRGSKGQAWHQDCPSDDPQCFNLNRLVYGRDVTAEEGGQILLIPGSHRRGMLPPGPVDEEFADQVELLPKQGTLVLIHGHLWHRVRPVNGAYRASTNYRCAGPGAADDITDVCVYRNMLYRFSTNEVLERR